MIGLLLLAVFIICLLTITDYWDNGSSLFDYEHFSMRSFFPILIFLIPLYELYHSIQISFNTNGIKAIGKEEIPYEQIVSVKKSKGPTKLIIVTRKNKFTLYNSAVKNLEALGDFLEKEKGVKVIPFKPWAIWEIVAIAIFVFFTFAMIFDKYGDLLKPILTLAKVEVLELEGTLEKPVSIWKVDEDNDKFYINWRGNIVLNEYPSYQFSYVGSRYMKEENFNLGKDKMNLAAGSKVSIKIRKKDLEHIKAMEPERAFFGISYFNKREKKYYGLKYEGQVLTQKIHIK